MSAPRRRPLNALAWGSSQASATLASAATAWMLSGITPSPLLNGLLPAAACGAVLLPLPPRPALGWRLQLLALVGLLTVARWLAPNRGDLAAALTLLASLIWAIGNQLSLAAVQGQLLTVVGLPLPWLRSSGELGRLLGTLLTGLLFPLARALGQFCTALLLLLPLLPTVVAASPSPSCRGDGPAARPGPTRRLHRRALAQGVLFGGCFALLPLWVRQQAAGTCLDFALVLSAYALGRTAAMATGMVVAATSPSRQGAPEREHSGTAQFGGMALLLLASQAVPAWLAVALFLPFGLLAGLRDQAVLLRCLDQRDQPDLAGFERSSALGGVTGALIMGLLTQGLGLGWALPLQVLGFLVAAVLSVDRPRRCNLGG